jgi:hypothetical protein
VNEQPTIRPRSILDERIGDDALSETRNDGDVQVADKRGPNLANRNGENFYSTPLPLDIVGTVTARYVVGSS